MQPEVLLQGIAEVLGADHGYSLRSVVFDPKPWRLQTAEEVEALLAKSEWAKAEGWVARQSGAFRWPGKDDPTKGAVLEAEVGHAGASLQIRRLGGEWACTRLEERSGEMLADEVALVTTYGVAARYRRYWTLPDHGAVEVVACRLVGFEDIGK